MTNEIKNMGNVIVRIGRTQLTGFIFSADSEKTQCEVHGVRGASYIFQVFSNGSARRISFKNGTSKDFASMEYTIDTVEAISA